MSPVVDGIAKITNFLQFLFKINLMIFFRDWKVKKGYFLISQQINKDKNEIVNFEIIVI